MAQDMLSRNSLDAVYDMTLAYAAEIPDKMYTHIVNSTLKHVQVRIKRYSIVELPRTEAGLRKWLQDLWRDKEATMKEFQKTKRLSKEFWEFGMDRSRMMTALVSWTCLTGQLIILSTKLEYVE